MYSKASFTRSPNSFRWYSNDSASGCTWITTEDVWSVDSQTMNANSLGSCSSTSRNMSADHVAYASALPGLIRDLLIMMNGPVIRPVGQHDEQDRRPGPDGQHRACAGCGTHGYPRFGD